MATYDLTQGIPEEIVTGDILNCPYSGAAISLTLPKGQFKLECWGAQGGNYNSGIGGKGGYSTGILSLQQKDINFYLYSGGYPGQAITAGYNGGTATSRYGGGGGGGTDIRIGSDSLYSRIIVAGGGGGCGYGSASPGGYGGGENGGAGTNGSYAAGGGGSQTSGGSCYNASGVGSFGNGGPNISDGGGAGGGWYGGGHGYSGGTDSAGGGGSGYVYTSSTASNYPSGCLLNSTYYLTQASTINGASSIVDPETSSSTTGRSGNGYIRITVIKAINEVEIYSKSNGNWFVSHLCEKQSGSWITEIEDLPSSFNQLKFFTPTLKENLVYNGNNQSPSLNNYYSQYQTLSGDQSKINVGTYNLIIGLNNNEYKWTDNTKINKTIQWIINKNPEGFSIDKNTAVITPSLSSIINIQNISGGTITITNSNPECCNAILENNKITITYIDVGESNITITCNETSNYLLTTKTVSVKAVLTAEAILDYFALPSDAISLTFKVGGI